MTEFPQMVPADVEAERHVIGSALLDAESADFVLEKLDVRDFYYLPHGWMFQAIGQLHASGQPVNAQTVIRRLGEMKQNGRSLLSMMDGPDEVTETLVGVILGDLDFWVERVRKKRVERDLLAFAERARKVAESNPENIFGELAKLEEQFAAVATSSDERGVYTLDDTMETLRSRIEQYIENPDGITGLATGWGIFDRYLDGLQPGNVTIVYAPSSRFKSLFVQNIGWLLARQDIPGLWFTTEMPRAQISERLLQLELGLNFRWLRRDQKIGEYRSAILSAANFIRNYPVFLNDRSDIDIGSIRAEVLKQKKWNNIQYVIIDLIDFVGASAFKEDSVAQQSLVMRQVKAMAKQCEVHVILVSHVAKGDRSIRSKPDLDVEEMKGSSSKYQDVDVAISLMPVAWSAEANDWYALDRAGITKRVEAGGLLTVLVAITKNRHGELGRIPFELDLSRGGRMYPVRVRSTQPTLPESRGEN